MVSSRLHLPIAVVVVLVSVTVALPVPDSTGEEFDAATVEPSPAPRSPKLPKLTPQDFGISDDDEDDDYYDYYEDESEYLTWEDLGRMIYSWAKLFAEPQQLKPMKRCLTGNAPRDPPALIKRIEACVRIIDPDFSVKKIMELILGS